MAVEEFYLDISISDIPWSSSLMMGCCAFVYSFEVLLAKGVIGTSGSADQVKLKYSSIHRTRKIVSSQMSILKNA
jgi:hypothetical protein